MVSAYANGEERLETEPMTSNPSLPQDLLLTCLARVSILHRPILSLVSKDLQSLLTSPELYKTISLLNRTETCLYVCLQFPTNPNPRWFTLCLKPNKTLIPKKTNKYESKGYVLAPVSFKNSPPDEWSDLVAVDHRLYAVCNPIKFVPCSTVSFLDCRTHTWLQAPNLRYKYNGILYGRNMYLPGSCENIDSLDLIDAFDTNTQTWKPVGTEKGEFASKDLEGKIYRTSCEFPDSVTLNAKDMTRDSGTLRLGRRGNYCLIEKILYTCCFNGEFEWFKWYGSDKYVYRKVKGLEGLLPKIDGYSSVNLADYGGKLVVFWDKYLPASWFREKVIWCAVISLEKRRSEDIWGKVEWFDAVLTVPRSYKFVYAVAATV